MHCMGKGIQKKIEPEFYEDLDKVKMGKIVTSKIEEMPGNKGK